MHLFLAQQRLHPALGIRPLQLGQAAHARLVLDGHGFAASVGPAQKSEVVLKLCQRLLQLGVPLGEIRPVPLLQLVYDYGIRTEFLPPVIFLGVGALTGDLGVLQRPSRAGAGRDQLAAFNDRVAETCDLPRYVGFGIDSAARAAAAAAVADGTAVVISHLPPTAVRTVDLLDLGTGTRVASRGAGTDAGAVRNDLHSPAMVVSTDPGP